MINKAVGTVGSQQLIDNVIIVREAYNVVWIRVKLKNW